MVRATALAPEPVAPSTWHPAREAGARTCSLGRTLASSVLRYLAPFDPATTADATTWSRFTPLG